MSSDLAARREARRRKILGNADDRLRKIMDGERGPPRDHIPNEPCEVPNSSPALQAMPNSVSSNSTEVKTIYVNPQPPRANSVNELYQLETKEKARRCIIMLMALLMRCLMLILEEYFTYFFKTSFANFHLNKVFIPLLTFELVEFQFFDPPLVRFGSLSTLLLLRLDPNNTQNVMVTLSTIMRLSQDVVVYFVTFIGFDAIISVILDER